MSVDAATSLEAPTTTLTIICAWCEKPMGRKDGQGSVGVTHSICDDCLHAERVKLAAMRGGFMGRIRLWMRRQPAGKRSAIELSFLVMAYALMGVLLAGVAGFANAHPLSPRAGQALAPFYLFVFGALLGASATEWFRGRGSRATDA